ncbi:MAG TPA: NAD(P)/FAD-dependent oxidoreductase [Herpetosiphonaceae bacterium]
MNSIIVIGAGQAGLAAGYYLRQAGLPFLILEAGAAPSGSWPAYYDSLTLFSPARYASLPGHPFPAAAETYPGRDAMAAYLRDYAAHFQLPIRTETRVARVERAGGGFVVRGAADESFAASAVIAASGAFARPFIPILPGQDVFQGRRLHSAAYQRPDDFAGARVVVVGAGNSAVQIAVELGQRATGAGRVSLATRQPLRFQPQRILGRDIHWWLTVTGLDSYPLDRPGGGWIRRRASGAVLDTGTYQAAIAAGRPDQRPMFAGFTPNGVVWADGAAEEVDAVIFATGYQPNLDYLAGLNALDAAGRPLHRRGMSTAVPGLAYVGLEQQRTFASATVRGAGPDAAWIVRGLQRELTRPARCCGWLPAVRP